MSDRQTTVMIVDDEEMVVTSIRSFLELDTHHRVLTFTSPSDALEALAVEHVHVIVADYMMPGMDGVTFLTEARDCRPQASRILLTGYADRHNAIRAINEAGLYHYLQKPWDNDELKLIIRNGVERSRLFNELDARVAALEVANEELSGLRQKLIEAFL
jgi:response regulator RpfG family c-di-GMP phosphodiesterase